MSRGALILRPVLAGVRVLAALRLGIFHSFRVLQAALHFRAIAPDRAMISVRSLILLRCRR